MNKKILMSLGAALAVVASVAAMSAYEAHVINVTAHIENALAVSTEAIEFGTVFPQEYLERPFTVSLSSSFLADDQLRLGDVHYKIVQKPKCINQAGEYAPVDYDTHQCPDGYKEMPLLCPYLSKTPVYEEIGDYGVPAFHDPATAIAVGTIHKDFDLSDEWIIDLAVPCFEGYCGQDWPAFVASHNPDANPKDYEATGDPAGTTFGCDLWVEVTNIY